MSKYENLSKEQLLKIVEKQEIELKNKKYGLVWDSEREPEQVVLDCENNLPVLKRVRGKEVRTNDEEDNILIEGDNYHALTVLNYTHKGKIDVIYIDPPYNTGAKDWKYNNNYVDENDGFRHSKWLNMMEKRLNLAKNLMTKDGLMIVAIDDNELHSLSFLIDKIFPHKVRNTVTVVHNPHGVSRSGFSRSHEYLIFVINYDQEINKKQVPEDLRNINLRRSGNNSLRADSPSMFYPIFVDKETLKIIKVGDVPSDNFHPNSQTIENLDDYEIWPIDDNGVEKNWYYSRSRIEKYGNDEVNIKWVKNKLHPYFKHTNNSLQTYKTVWIGKEYDSGIYGATLVKNITKTKFPFPKSIYSIIDSLKAVMKNKNSTVLDFFAGSGTTGHAVLELNKEDGGNRKFILCTNNENNICTEVTYPRIEKVINGYDFKGKDKTTLFEKKITWKDFSNKADEINEQINLIIEENNEKFDKIEKNIEDGILKITGIKNIDGKKEGLGGNLQYFKTSFVKKTNNRDQVKLNLTRKCTEMLCVKENIFNEEKTEEDFKIFYSNKKDKFLCVYYNFVDDNFDQFLAELKKLNGKKIIYMFSFDNKIDKNLFKEINNFTIEPIPQNILEVYKQLVKMNIPEKKEIIFVELGKANKKIFEENNKDEGARILRIVLEKTIQKIAQTNGINILNEKGQEEKISKLNDILKGNKTFSPLIWEENKTCLVIGNNAAHGDYDEYDLKNVKQFYKHVQSLLDNYNI